MDNLISNDEYSNQLRMILASIGDFQEFINHLNEDSFDALDIELNEELYLEPIQPYLNKLEEVKNSIERLKNSFIL